MNNRLSTHDLALLLSERTGKSKEEALRFLQELVSVAGEALRDDRSAKVKGLGTFRVIRVEERASVSVNSGERFLIPSHYKLAFAPDKGLKEWVNKPFSFFETVELNEGVDFAEAGAPSDAEEEASPEAVPPVLPPAPVPGKRKKKPPVLAVLFLAACLAAVAAWGFFRLVRPGARGGLDREGPLPEASAVTADDVFAEAGRQAVPAETAAAGEATAVADSSASEAPVPEETVSEEASRPETMASVTIKAGDRLVLFAKKYYGHKFFWVYIYEYNKEAISDPDNIPIGTELQIPAPEMYGIDASDRASVEKAALLQAQILGKFGR